MAHLMLQIWFVKLEVAKLRQLIRDLGCKKRLVIVFFSSSISPLPTVSRKYCGVETVWHFADFVLEKIEHPIGIKRVNYCIKLCTEWQNDDYCNTEWGWLED